MVFDATLARIFTGVFPQMAVKVRFLLFIVLFHHIMFKIDRELSVELILNHLMLSGTNSEKNLEN